LRNRLGSSVDAIVTHLTDGAEELHPTSAAAAIDTGVEVQFHLEDTEPEEARDTVVRELAKIFDVPVSLVSVVDHDKDFWAARFRQSADTEQNREDSLCSQLESAKELVIVEDMAKDPRFADNTFLEERGVKFFASAPLQTRDSHAVGSLCVMDTKPHEVTEREKQLFAQVAQEFMRVLCRRQLEAA